MNKCFLCRYNDLNTRLALMTPYCCVTHRMGQYQLCIYISNMQLIIFALSQRKDAQKDYLGEIQYKR